MLTPQNEYKRKLQEKNFVHQSIRNLQSLDSSLSSFNINEYIMSNVSVDDQRKKKSSYHELTQKNMNLKAVKKRDSSRRNGYYDNKVVKNQNS